MLFPAFRTDSFQHVVLRILLQLLQFDDQPGILDLLGGYHTTHGVGFDGICSSLSLASEKATVQKPKHAQRPCWLTAIELFKRNSDGH